MCKLHVDSVEMTYEGKKILQDIFISCEKGEIVGLLGRNGSGKSTLLKVIFGAVKADFSFVSINDKVVKSVIKRRKYISYLYQDHFLPSHLVVEKMVDMLCDDKYVEIVKRHQFVAPNLSKKARELSGGELRLIEIFLILYSSAEIILLDEPFNGVAPLYKEEIKSTIRNLSIEKGIIVTDHDYNNILDVATKTVLIHEGHYKNISNREELSFWGYLP